MKEAILCLDVETGGLNPKEHSLLQLGFVLYVNKKIVDTLEINIKEIVYKVTPEAMKHNGLDLLTIKETGLNKEDAVAQVIKFIEKNLTGGEKPILLGHNAFLDRSFTQELFESVGDDFKNHISHRNIDTMSLIWGLYDLGKLPKEACSSQGAFDYFGIKVEDRHTGLGDSIATVELYEELLKLMK